MKFLILSALLLSMDAFALPNVSIEGNQFRVGGVAQPQLFGAELQYFRLRGGYGKNIPRAKVIALWNKALDRMVEAKMNAVSFYIPWDFHEYAEGKFDFSGTADEDGDGNPDYPSRDLHTFFRLIEEHGIKHIMVRPGPYINAEWGFLGFGAIPEWFHNKFPDSHMRNAQGWRTKLYDYHNPDLLGYTERWFTRLYQDVLHDKIGKPIEFVQLDNETNFMWQSIFNHDYGPRAVGRYRKFLQERFGSVQELNRAHQRDWKSWAAVRPPVEAGKNLAEDRSWYKFQDFEMYDYLAKIRGLWEKIGVREPDIFFTLAESYNATGNGVLPNYIYRNAPGKTGMMTVNLYPKTFETAERALHNLPLKTDLDVLSADEGNNFYLGKSEEWVLGPEVQAGWWKGIDVSSASRQQTYLSSIGHGMKALFLYYFNEGDNWDAHWAFEHVQPLYQQLLVEWNLERADPARLDNQFWDELQARSDRQLLMGFDVRHLMRHEPEEKLYFDAPLNAEAEPNDHFEELKTLGEKIIHPHQDFLSRSVNVYDSVAIVKDSASHAPSSDLDSLLVASEWAGGLLGYLLNDGLNPRIFLGETSPSFAAPKLLFHLDSGGSAPETDWKLKAALERGQGLVNILGDASLRKLGVAVPAAALPARNSRVSLTYYVNAKGQLTSRGSADGRPMPLAGARPFYSYDLSGNENCQAMLYWNEAVVGYRCRIGVATVMQLGALIFDDYNSSDYANLTDPEGRRAFLRALTREFGVEPGLKLGAGAERVAAFARTDGQSLWITVKTGTRRKQHLRLTIGSDFLPSAAAYEIEDLFGGHRRVLTSAEITGEGFRFDLSAEGSTVLLVQPISAE